MSEEDKSFLNNNIIIPISVKTIFYIILAVFLLWVIYTVKNVILIIFLAMILALSLQPVVDWFKKRGLKHSFAVVLTVLFFIIIILGLFSIAVIPFIQQSQTLIDSFPVYIDTIINGVPAIDASFIEKINAIILENLGNSSGGVLNITLGVFSLLINFVLVMSFMGYMLMDFENIREGFIKIIPTKDKTSARSVIVDIETKLGGWLRGQALFMFIVGLMTYIGLMLLGVDYALALAVIAGLLEIIPYIGPITATIPAAILGFSVSPMMGFAVLGLYILIQQVEANFIIPKVYQKTVGVNPLLTIIALMVGGQLFGIIGAILAVPFTIILVEILTVLSNKE